MGGILHGSYNSFMQYLVSISHVFVSMLVLEVSLTETYNMVGTIMHLSRHLVKDFFLQTDCVLFTCVVHCGRISYYYLILSVFTLPRVVYSHLGYLQLRVDGVLMRLRDTRMHCVFRNNENPVILRETCWREGRFDALSSVSLFPSPFHLSRKPFNGLSWCFDKSWNDFYCVSCLWLRI